MAETVTKFPAQCIPFKSKGKKWRHDVVDWGATKTYFNFAPVRKNVVNMKINYDLLNGKIHMQDVAAILNPGNISTAFLPDKIQHYPIINSKLNTLRGEEAARVFDWRAIVTNPESVSQIERDKKAEFLQSLQGIVEDQTIDDAQAQQQVQELQKYYNYNWQDFREIRANEIIKHFSREQNFKQTFNDGFVDAMTVGQEIYEIGIVGGEPKIARMNPIKFRTFRSGYSNNIEDADVILYEDYWSPGRIIDTYYDDLSTADVKYLSDEIPNEGYYDPVGPAGNYDDRYGLFNASYFVGEDGVEVNSGMVFETFFDELNLLDGGIGSSLLPYDVVGNVRVLRIWWKSKRKILKVKSYDEETGEEEFNFYPETYVVNEAAGEEAETLWINEAWEGTKIGEKIYCRIRPCVVQFNTLTNPSRCHFGIIGTIYNINENRPFSLVDMMKPYNYLYDAVHAKLVDLIATNWGKLLEMDLALKPKNWEVEKWMYFARANKVLIKDSFNEGSKGAAQGKLAAGLNNASKGYIDADWGQSIQNYINILQWTKDSMSDLVGINRQREGNTYSRETVGGIERAVLQSSYITDWLFQKHEDTKRRVLEAFLEVAKAAYRGRNIKFQYILSDGSLKMMEFDGDEFAESDYGIVVDNSNDTQKLYQQMDAITQAAMQNQYRLSSIMKLYSSASLQEKMRGLENMEDEMQRQQQELQQQQAQAQQQLEQMRQQTELQKMQFQDTLNQRDNDTKIKVAEINSQAEYLRLGIYAEENDEELVHEKLDIEREKLAEQIRQFDMELRQKDDELKVKKDIENKKIEAQKQIAGMRKTTTAKK